MGPSSSTVAQIPLLMLTADRPAELRDTGSNQTIRQPGTWRVYRKQFLFATEEDVYVQYIWHIITRY